MIDTITPGILITVLNVSAGIAASSAIACLVAAWMGVPIRGIKWLIVMCISATCYQLLTSSFHTAHSVPMAFEIKRWQNLSSLFQLYGMVGFLAAYTRFQHMRSLRFFMNWGVGILVALTFLWSPDQQFMSEFHPHVMSFPWGEQLLALQGKLSIGSLAGRSFFLAFFVWAFFMAVGQASREDRLGALILGIGVLLLISAVVIGTLIDYGKLNFIYPGGFGYILFSVFALHCILHELKTSQLKLTHTAEALSRELDEHRQTQQVVEHLSYNDKLTDLPSRAGFFRLVEQSIAVARQQNVPLAMLHIDLDRFDVVNDTLGPQVGDRLLQQVSQRIMQLIQGKDYVARINADEFICIIHAPHASERAWSLSNAIHEALRLPFDIRGHQLHITASMGIALFPTDADHADALLTAADLATREAKRLGRDRTQCFLPQLNAAIHERMQMGNALRTALAERQFELYFQPLIDARSGKVASAEALIRWHHPERGMVPPDRFIPVAEEMRLIGQIGAWVIDEACRTVATWRKEGFHDLRVAVNLSAQQLHQDDLVDIVSTALERHGLTGQDLGLEVTESMLMENPDFCIAQLNHLKDFGIKLAMDDFGTGYSSLAYLKRLPIDTLKIDRSFVRDIEVDENDRAICATTISMANSLGLSTVAEGVETDHQARMLRELNCDCFQGYFYAKPMPASAAMEFIRQRAASHLPADRS